MSNSRPRFTAADRRARLASRHHIAPWTAVRNVADAARDLVGLHASDPVSVYLGAWARVDGFATADLDAALYDERSVVKILGMRRTMFVEALDVAALVHRACATTIAKGERPRFLRMLAEAGIAGDPETWVADVEARTVDALRRLGEATASELTREVPELRGQIPFGAGKRWEGTMGVSTRLLFLLAAEGRIIRGRPKGGITSSLYRWTALDRWIAGGLPEIPPEAAQLQLVRRYLRAFGPARLEDVKWWTGWTMGDTRRAVERSRAIEADLDDGGQGLVLPDDVGDDAGARPSFIAFLPALDSTTMGWTDRRFFLGEHRGALFDRAGNGGPSIWLDGRIVGGWAQRKDGRVAWRLLEDVGSEAESMVVAKAADLEAWLGDLRFIPRFRTPLAEELYR